MEIKSEPHGFALLQKLNSQRRTGRFCDCVIRLQLHPDQLFMAHKSILAAFSPVLVSLLPSHGSLLELNSPQLTPEMLVFLLEYMYTGTLPPSTEEKLVLNVAFDLQMEPLQKALVQRRQEMEQISEPDQLKINKTKDHSIAKIPSACSSFYSSSSDQPESCSPSYEEVPVICHVKAVPTQIDDRTLDVKHSEKQCHSRELKMVKSSLMNMPSEMFVEFNSKDIVELKSNEFQLCLSTAERDQSSQSSYSCSENLSSWSKEETKCVTRTLDPKMHREIDDCVTNASVDSKSLETVEDAISVEDEYQSYQFSNQRSDCMNLYRGRIRYHCVHESDLDSDLPCSVLNAEIENNSRVVKTINAAEISLLATESSGSSRCSRNYTFQCSVCERAFSQRGSLNRHMRSHLGVRPYSCPRCPMTFSRQYRVSEHMRVHLRSCPDPP